MKAYKLNLLAICTIAILLTACKKNDSVRETIADGRISFNVPASTDVVVVSTAYDIKTTRLVTLEMKASLQGNVSSDAHYVTFAPDTTKITDYKTKYGSAAVLLPTSSYLFYKPTVTIAAGSSLSDAAVLNLSFQKTLKKFTTYVLPLAITTVDGVTQDPRSRKVVYYVLTTGDGLYLDNSAYTITATASSVNSTLVANNAVDANLLGTYWLSNITQALPQWLNIDLKRDVTFSGLEYYFPTAVNYTTLGAYPTSAKIETSSDNITWVDKGTYAVDIRNADRMSVITLASPATARYVRINVLAAAPYVSGANSYSVAFISGILFRN
ncbi:discoidin domain-containing protein [Pedobacter paludis]|uniref:Sialidase n=1 Tax=Pedobacter paludis TaxID=2203212 RepID=A0A317ETV1_9SPHI|nr:discoidin domain-containing protein [Pedobacter paludis]PWS30370.1 sialidase [Pedobacter paludis]